MPDSRISALPSATSPLAGTEVLPIVQSGVTDKVTAADLLRQSGQTVTTSNPVLSLAQTWNAGGVTFTGAVINITDTASATSSHYFKVQNAGNDVFSIYKQASSLVGMRLNDTAGAPRFGVSSNGGQTVVQLISSAGNNGYLSSDGSNNTVALQFGTNAQAFRVYNTFTDTSNYERGIFDWTTTANTLTIGTAKGGTGANRNVALVATANLFVGGGGLNAWVTGSSGHWLANVDNTYDIGASGATRPRSLYVGTDINMGGTFNRVSGSYSTILDNSGIRITSLGGTTGALRMLQTGIADNYINNEASTGNMVFVSDNAISEFKSGTEAQTVRVYNTFTDSSNYERGSIAWNSNNFDITVGQSGTGSARSMRVFTTGSASLQLGANNSLQWSINTSGHFLAATDNTYDIGASGATRPRTVYAATSFISGNAVVAGSAGSFQFANRTILQCPSDGVLTLQNNAASDFTRLQFGGTTSSFPALARSGTLIQARLADNSSLAPFECSGLDATSGNVRAGGSVLAHFATAIPAGGTAGAGLRVSSVSNFGVFFGSGAPTLSAAKGSLYLRSDGSGVADRMYVNTDSSTGWTAVATVA